MQVEQSFSLSLTPRRAALLTLAVALPLGLTLAYFPFATATVLLAAALTVGCTRAPRPDLAFLLTFLLLQDTLRIGAGAESQLADYLRRADEPLIILLGAASLLRSRVRRGMTYRWIWVPLAGCYGGMLLSSLPMRADLVAMAIDLVLFSKAFLIFGLGVSVAPSTSDIERYLPRVLWVFTGVLLTGLLFLIFPNLQQVYLGSLEATEQRLGMLAAQGPFIDVGVFSWFAAATCGLAYAAWLTLERRPYLVHAGFAALMVLLTWRRKSILAVAVILVTSLLVVARREMRPRVIVPVAVAGVLVLALLPPYISALTVSTVEEYGDSNPYANARAALYYTGFLIARDHFPLGVGLASFGSHASRLYYSDVYREYGLSHLHGLAPWASGFITDTYWPMVLGQGGVVSLVSYLSFLLLLGLSAARTLRAQGVPAGGRFLAAAAVFLLAGSFVESIASHIYGASLQAALVLVPVGMYWRNELDRRRPQD